MARGAAGPDPQRWESGLRLARVEKRRSLCLDPPLREPWLVSFDPSRTAVVLIEYQNDFASEGGPLHDAVEQVMRTAPTLAR